MREVAEVDLRLPNDGTARLRGDAGDTSVIGSIATAGGHYEPGLTAALEAVTEPDWVCLDIGANVGAIALTLGLLCPDGQVHAFEPVPATYAFLAENIVHNKAQHVHAYQIALTDRTAEVVINYNPESSGAAFISDHLEHGERSTVKATTLDEWVAGEGGGLERLDFVKIDVEGSELAVLDGAVATLRQFRPVIVVELNPITIRRMAHREPGDLYRRLCQLVGRRGHIAAIPDTGPMTPIVSWRHVQRVIAEHGLINLYCSPRPIRPGSSPGVAAPRASVRAWAAGMRRWSKWGRPAWAAIEDPHIRLRVDQLPTGGTRPRLAGRPGERLVLPLLAYNRGAATIVGDAPKFAVTTRVIWIDEAGRHSVDDRSRVAVPRMRPGTGGSIKMPVYLPEEPGAYTLRITFFQDYMCWFHDLDDDNRIDVDVHVDLGVAAGA